MPSKEKHSQVRPEVSMGSLRSELRSSYNQILRLPQGQHLQSELHALVEQEMRRDAAHFPEQAMYLCTEMGALEALLYWEDWHRSRFEAEASAVTKSLETLQMLLSLNTALAEWMCSGPSLGKLVHVAKTLLTPYSFMSATALFHTLLCLLHIVAVSPSARERIVHEDGLMHGIILILPDGKHQTFLGIQPLQRLCLEFLYAVCHGSSGIRHSDFPKRDSVCGVCLNETIGQAYVWSCPCCHHSLHRECASPWFKKNSSCPTCRCLVFCAEGTIDRVLRFLRDPGVDDSLHLTLMGSMLAVHLAMTQESSVDEAKSDVIDLLKERNVASALSEALSAAVAAQPWPPNSNAFPLVWRLAMSVSHLAHLGFHAELRDTVAPLATVALRSSQVVALPAEAVHWSKEALRALAEGDGDDAVVKTIVQSVAEATNATEAELEVVYASFNASSNYSAQFISQRRVHDRDSDRVCCSCCSAPSR